MQHSESLRCGDQKAKVAVIGIGNELAGDDAAGIEVVRRLSERWRDDNRVFLYALETDLFEIADLLERAERFIFVDATLEGTPGDIRPLSRSPHPLAPSLHQTDIASVMHRLQATRIAEPFPPWETFGITVTLPLTWGKGLSEPVARSVAELVERLDALIVESTSSG
ncbi:MAG: hydrogenase maturation protease [Acidobacteriota bacterium]